MSPTPSPAQRRRLAAAARRAARSAYAPYSKFPVGAAVLTGSGKIFAGCNVENASYGLCNCAERTAIFSAVAAGEREVRAVAVYTPTPHPTLPCGACRQVINEFGPEAVVLCLCDTEGTEEETLPGLLPGAFGPADLLTAPARTDKRRQRPAVR
ncbi:MAG: cytidine deaminase [Verrucomicrobia bacterium]|jgi:cytidine deaminase|nr:cytidine deaminase [Verrucomicrobiota bacterium]